MVSYLSLTGIIFQSHAVLILIVVEDGLVPLLTTVQCLPHRLVLILIVVEDGLVHSNCTVSVRHHHVLILIVVEDGLVPTGRGRNRSKGESLNPYCSGRWSRTKAACNGASINVVVLILIVVEDGLVLSSSLN